MENSSTQLEDTSINQLETTEIDTSAIASQLVADLLKEFRLVLYNDDVNSFDHVIDCLINYCGHDAFQAEQCAIIVHFKGKCTVKEGEYDKLVPIANTLLNRGLKVKVE